jgi:hypothetical protein
MRDDPGIPERGEPTQIHGVDLATDVDETYGILTLTRDGKAVLGLPTKLYFSPQLETALGARVEQWMLDGSGSPLVLPFPVDVDDQRREEDFGPGTGGVR